MESSVSNKKEVKEKKVSKKKVVPKFKKQDNTSKENKRDKAKNEKILVDTSKKKIELKKYLTKVNITYFILVLLDIILVIYLARQNIVNYVKISDVEVFVSKTRYLLWGRNYVNLIAIAFFYIYTCLVNKFFLGRKNDKKFLLWLLVGLVVLNVLLFIIFTKRVY